MGSARKIRREDVRFTMIILVQSKIQQRKAVF
jgi:hypothetical protein